MISKLEILMVNYDGATDRVQIKLSDGNTLKIDSCQIQGLSDATPTQIATAQIYADRAGIYWEELEIRLSVQDLVTSRYGDRCWMKKLPQPMMVARKTYQPPRFCGKSKF